jgi:hypothetical protein
MILDLRRLGLGLVDDDDDVGVGLGTLLLGGRRLLALRHDSTIIICAALRGMDGGW